MKTDEELLKTFKFTMEDNNLIQIVLFGSENEEDNNGRQAELIVEHIGKIASVDKSKNYNFLIDLTTAGSIHSISSKAREAYQSLSKFTNLNKSAVVGKSMFLEVTANLIVQALGRGSRFKWFETIDQAKEWLAEN